MRGGDRHTLLLAARKMGGIAVHELRDAHLLEVGLGPFSRFGTAQPEYMERRLGHVLEHRHVGPQVEMLEHHCQPGAQALQLPRVGHLEMTVAIRHQADFLAGDGDAAGIWLLEEVDAAQEGALARSGGADDADDIARLGGQRHTLEHFVVAVALVQVFDRKLSHGDSWRVCRSGLAWRDFARLQMTKPAAFGKTEQADQGEGHAHVDQTREDEGLERREVLRVGIARRAGEVDQSDGGGDCGAVQHEDGFVAVGRQGAAQGARHEIRRIIVSRLMPQACAASISPCGVARKAPARISVV